VFLPKLENFSEFTKQIVMEVEGSVVNLPNPEAAKYSLTRIAWRMRCAQEETSESL
jgi:glucose-6-phosphate isomerase